MNFDNVDIRLSSKAMEIAHRQWLRLTVELGVRNNNEWVGSGLGGNNFQLLVLMGMAHFLTADPNVTIVPGAKEITWGAAWLEKASITDMRKELDRVFPDIMESRKFQALALEEISKSTNLRLTLEENKEHFPQLMGWLAGGGKTRNWYMSNQDMLIWAYVVCQELASDLDKGDLSKIGRVAEELSWLHPEIILLSVRKFIQIDRIVRFDLDEHPVWDKMLRKVCSLTR